MPLGFILEERKILIYTSQRERVGNVVDGQRRRGPNESKDKDSPFKLKQTSWRAEKKVEVKVTLVLRMDQNFVNSMKMQKGNGNTLLFFLKGFKILHRERGEQANTIVMQHFKITSTYLPISSILLNQSVFISKFLLSLFIVFF